MPPLKTRHVQQEDAPATPSPNRFLFRPTQASNSKSSLLASQRPKVPSSPAPAQFAVRPHFSTPGPSRTQLSHHVGSGRDARPTTFARSVSSQRFKSPASQAWSRQPEPIELSSSRSESADESLPPSPRREDGAEVLDVLGGGNDPDAEMLFHDSDSATSPPPRKRRHLPDSPSALASTHPLPFRSSSQSPSPSPRAFPRPLKSPPQHQATLSHAHFLLPTAPLSASAAPQTFRPRFLPATSTTQDASSTVAMPCPDVFSPQHRQRGAGRYMAGGMASEVLGWVMKAGNEVMQGGGGGKRREIVVGKVREGEGLTLVKGMVEEEDEEEGEEAGKGKQDEKREEGTKSKNVTEKNFVVIGRVGGSIRKGARVRLQVVVEGLEIEGKQWDIVL